MTLLYTTASDIADALRRQAERRARRLLAKHTGEALGWVDDRTLRDIGMTRSEIGSLASEVAGEVEATRQRVALMHR